MATVDEIRRKNDLFRKSFIGGKVLITQGIKASPNLEKIIQAVKEFEDFHPGNDPHREHDFSKIVVNGEEVFWKIDYYDKNYEFWEEDGHRVLTIMLCSEY